jgi:transmembrane sensor
MKYPDRLIANYLAGECSEAEANELTKWRTEKPEHEIHFKKMEALWIAGKISRDDFNPDLKIASEVIYQKIAQREISSSRQQTSRTRYYYAVRIAATLVIVTSAALGYYFYNARSYTMATVETNSASKKEILLPDGSRVWLNGQSQLQYSKMNETGNREVNLEGEAYFEVVKNAARPFLIHTRSSVTQVIGTSFNIRSYANEEDIMVTVASGLVSFYEASHPDKKILLSKGERGVLEKDSSTPEKELNADANFLSWKTNTIVFGNTSLDLVAATLARHFHKKIRIDKALSRCRFTSTFEEATLNDILEELVLVLNIKIDHQGDVVELSGKSCE